jgi:hypothetical protein
MRIIRGILSLWIAASLLVSCSSEKPSAPEVAAKAPDETAATAALKDINRAQADFIRRTRRYAQSTDELIADRLLSGEPAADGYTVQMLPSADAVSYTVTATPRTPDGRHFFTDKTGVIRAETGKPATPESPEP